MTDRARFPRDASTRTFLDILLRRHVPTLRESIDAAIGAEGRCVVGAVRGEASRSTGWRSGLIYLHETGMTFRRGTFRRASGHIEIHEPIAIDDRRDYQQRRDGRSGVRIDEVLTCSTPSGAVEIGAIDAGIDLINAWITRRPSAD